MLLYEFSCSNVEETSLKNLVRFQEGLKGLEKIRKGAMMDSVETVKIDDPRLDESFSFLFVFRKGDMVVNRENRTLRGRINDGVYLGEFPSRAAGALNPKGKTVYEVKLPDDVLQIFDEKEIEKAGE
jgi:hypothetical protein